MWASSYGCPALLLCGEECAGDTGGRIRTTIGLLQTHGSERRIDGVAVADDLEFVDHVSWKVCEVSFGFPSEP